MKRNIITFGTLLVIVVAFIVAMLVWGPFSPKIEGLEGVEIRLYEGKDLSSINDLRENSIRGPQEVDLTTYRLEITGLVETPQSFTYDQVTGGYPVYEKVIRLNCVEGWSVNILWEGVLIRDLISEAGPHPEARVAILHAVDGYTTSFPIEYLVDNDIILAHKMNGVVLPASRGYPFELAAESKWGYKWIRWVTRVELSDNVDYRGFWESKGFSPSGDLDEPY